MTLLSSLRRLLTVPSSPGPPSARPRQAPPRILPPVAGVAGRPHGTHGVDFRRQGPRSTDRPYSSPPVDLVKG